MSFLGLMTRKEAQKHIEDSIKAAMYENLPSWLLREAEAEHLNIPDPSVHEAQSDLYRKLSSVLRSCSIPGAAAAVVPFSVKRVVREKEPKDIPNHPFELLLTHPNELESRFDFIQATIIEYQLTGNFYWWMNAESKDAPPDEMWLIPSHMIRPIPDGRMFIRGYYYYPGTGEELILEPYEIMHCKRFNPFSRFVGLSAMEAIAVEAYGYEGMQRWNAKLFADNNARLPGILTFEQMYDDGTWEKIKAQMTDNAKKRQIMTLRGVGQGAVNWLQTAVNQKEMEFLEGLRMIDKDIMDTLAPGLYTWLSGDSTLANAGANRAAFNELYLYPTLEMIAQSITNKILPRYGGRELVGMFDDVRYSDRQLELEEIKQYSETHTLDEVRQEKYGDEPIGDERGELLLVQINAQSGGLQEPPPAPPPANAQPGSNTDNTQNNNDASLPNDTPADPTNKAALDDLARYQRKAVKKIGQVVDFSSDLIPSDVLDNIRSRLGACKSETAVKAVFDVARDGMKPKKATDASKLIEAMYLSVRALEAQKG